VKGKRNLRLPVAFAGLVLAFALTRLPGVLPLNFSAAYALAFCAGVYLPGRLAWALPLGVMFGTDLLLNLLYYRVNPVTAYALVNYAGYGLIIAVGRSFRPRASWGALLGGGLLGAILFYLLTNTAAWLQDPAYAKTLAGWLQALTSGVPGYPPTWTFFRNTLLSGGLFTGLFVGAMKLGEAREPEEESAAEDAEDAEPEETTA
jgi:hypothetical protein